MLWQSEFGTIAGVGSWLAGALFFFASFLAYRVARRKHVHLWLPAYLRDRVKCSARRQSRTCLHVIFCFVDHFEPIDCGRSRAESDRIMQAWVDRYPRLARRHADSTGAAPQHTWFYPGEAYQPSYLEALGSLVRQGLGEVELHLHHDGDSEDSLGALLEQCKEKFARHGALITAEPSPRFAYSFIHGNTALCNSRARGISCGVNDELRVLRESGCFADFSFPTYPAESQPRKVNSIYYASSSPERPREYDSGVDVQVGGQPQGDLLLIQGPLALNWRRRKFLVLPHVENGEISGANPGTADRIRLWVRQSISVQGRPDLVFVKVHCHGCQERDFEALLGEPADRMYAELEAQFRDRPGCKLHYVTAREMYNIIKAAEAGKTGDPHAYRDYLIPPYQNRVADFHSTVNSLCVELQEL